MRTLPFDIHSALAFFRSIALGSCFGFVTHDFSAIVDFCDDLVRREIPLIPEAVHRFFDDVCDLSGAELEG